MESSCDGVLDSLAREQAHMDSAVCQRMRRDGKSRFVMGFSNLWLEISRLW